MSVVCVVSLSFLTLFFFFLRSYALGKWSRTMERAVPLPVVIVVVVVGGYGGGHKVVLSVDWVGNVSRQDSLAAHMYAVCESRPGLSASALSWIRLAILPRCVCPLTDSTPSPFSGALGVLQHSALDCPESLCSIGDMLRTNHGPSEGINPLAD